MFLSPDLEMVVEDKSRNTLFVRCSEFPFPGLPPEMAWNFHIEYSSWLLLVNYKKRQIALPCMIFGDFRKLQYCSWQTLKTV